MPHLVEMVKKFSEEDFMMIGIDTTNRPEMAREYVESIGANWPHLMDDKDVAGTTFDVPGVPLNLFIDQNGNILFRSIGFREGDERVIEETVTAMVERLRQNS